MTDSKNVLGVADWTENTDELENQLKTIQDKLHFSQTMAERQKLDALKNEVNADRVKVKELEARAYEIGISNKAKIKTLKDEAERLRLESFDLSADAWELQTRLRVKQMEMNLLEKIIRDAKNTV
jgi:hypothetical protein